MVRDIEEKRIKKEWGRDLWDMVKLTNICIIEFPEGEEIEKRAAIFFKEITTKNLHNWEKETDQNTERLKKFPKIHPKGLAPRYVIFKLSEVKDEGGIWKAAKEKQFVAYVKTTMRWRVDSSAETL